MSRQSVSLRKRQKQLQHHMTLLTFWGSRTLFAGQTRRFTTLVAGFTGVTKCSGDSVSQSVADTHTIQIVAPGSCCVLIPALEVVIGKTTTADVLLKCQHVVPALRQSHLLLFRGTDLYSASPMSLDTLVAARGESCNVSEFTVLKKNMEPILRKVVLPIIDRKQLTGHELHINHDPRFAWDPGLRRFVVYVQSTNFQTCLKHVIGLNADPRSNTTSVSRGLEMWKPPVVREPWTNILVCFSIPSVQHNRVLVHRYDFARYEHHWSIWSAKTKLLQTIPNFLFHSLSFHLQPKWHVNERHIAFASSNKRAIKIVDVVDGIQHLKLPCRGRLFKFEWSPCGRWIAAQIVEHVVTDTGLRNGAIVAARCCLRVWAADTGVLKLKMANVLSCSTMQQNDFGHVMSKTSQISWNSSGDKLVTGVGFQFCEICVHTGSLTSLPMCDMTVMCNRLMCLGDGMALDPSNSLLAVVDRHTITIKPYDLCDHPYKALRTFKTKKIKIPHSFDVHKLLWSDCGSQLLVVGETQKTPSAFHICV